jgi:hypothetical protein
MSALALPPCSWPDDVADRLQKARQHVHGAIQALAEVERLVPEAGQLADALDLTHERLGCLADAVRQPELPLETRL